MPNEPMPNEPSTEEIVSQLKTLLPNRVDYAELVGAGSIYSGHLSVWDDPCGYHLENAINRLESQQREIERLKGENRAMNDHILVATGVAGCFAEYLPVTICGMPIAEAVSILSNHGALNAKLTAETARADAAIKASKRFGCCSTCEHAMTGLCETPCNTCDESYNKWEMRGAPSDAL